LPPRAALEVHFCARRQVPSADLVTQVGFTTRINDTGVTKPRVNPALGAMPLFVMKPKDYFCESIFRIRANAEPSALFLFF